MRDWKKWFQFATVRAVKTVAQTVIATIGTSTMTGDINWFSVISASLIAGVLSFLMSIMGLPEEE